MSPPTALAAETAAQGPAADGLSLRSQRRGDGHWTPEKEGTDYTLPSILEPLANLKNELSVLTD